MVSMPSFEIVPLPSLIDQQEAPSTLDFSIIENIVVPVIDPEVASIASVESDITKEEICEKIKAVVDENNELKKKLLRNNKIMHEQLNIIALCHDKIAETSSKHRSILENTVQRNAQLQEENEHLSKRLAMLEKMMKEKKKQMKNFCQDAVCEDFDVFNDDESGYAIVLPSATSVDASSQESLLQTSLSESKVDQLSKELEEEKHMVSNIMKLLSEKEEEICALKENQTMLMEKGKNEITTLKEDLSAVAGELHESKKQTEDLLVKVNEQNKINEELELQVSDSKQIEEGVKKDLFDVQQLNQLIKTELEDAQKKSFQLTSENKSLKDQLQSQKELLTEKLRNECSANEGVKSYETDEMMARMMSMEQELEAEREKVENMSRKLTSEDNESETVKLLQVQVEAYRVDFLAEKTAHQAIKSEVEGLRQRLKEFEDKQENSPFHGFRNRSGRHQRHRNSRSSSAEQEGNVDFECPKCSFEFSSLRALENHVQRCLDN